MMRTLLMKWLHLQLLVATVTDAACRDDNYTAPSVIHVGLLQPLEGPLGFESTGSAATMAVRDAQRRGYLNQTHVEYSYPMFYLFDLIFRSRKLNPFLGQKCPSSF